jgi:multiple sugar transport system permease protein
LGAALLLNRRSRVLEAIRALFIIPMVLPPIVVAILWKVLFTPDISVLNWVLGLGHLPQPAWLAEPRLALPAIVVADVWEWFPFTLLMLLAALQMMPAEPIEAARIDGAGTWQVFRHVVLPLLRPAIVVTVLFRLIESVKAFPLIFIMTGGGPGTVTEATNYYAFLQGFTYSLLGFSAAISVVVLAGTFLLSYVIVRWVGTQVDVE